MQQIMIERNCISKDSLCDYEKKDIGIDETVGRFGEVSILKCKLCGKMWLHYFVEYEAFSQSGRWYSGLISDEIAQTVTAETAVRVLESLDWYHYGGSYFRESGIRKGSGTVSVNLGGGSDDTYH